ncbi:MAG: hypothetical protein HY815_26960, partial [Candidatus Riflebacteria bacterium]|nr:hypothetical protein [Candidatus Riflebacteria bacterium]
MIADREAYQPGDTARVLLTSEFRDSHVLFTVEGEAVLDSRVLSMTGRSQGLELPIADTHSPNVFLSAMFIRNGTIWAHQTKIYVPPTRKLLKVTMVAGQETYKPREKGQFDLEVTDWTGKPVETSLSLGFADASVYAVAPDSAPEIKSFFWGQKRPNGVGTSATIPSARPRPSMILHERAETEVTRQKSFMEPAAVLNGDVAERTSKKGDMGKEGGGGGPALAEPAVREYFPDTAFWSPSIVTDAGGKAHVTVEFPDSLTTWKATFRGVTADTAVGGGELSVITRKNLILRLKTPRFVTQRDELSFTMIVHNYLKSEKEVTLELDAGGLEVVGASTSKVKVPADGEKAVDFAVRAPKAGDFTLLARALTDQESDAIKIVLPAVPHGVDKFVATSGQTVDRATIVVSVPKDRIRESTTLRLVVTPSIASGLVSCLSYLARYPYGCVEQTMSRFLPCVAVAHAFRSLGVPTARVEGDLDGKVKAGLERLFGFQHDDGGWGWWKSDPSTNAMTAYVLEGLARARSAGVDVSRDLMRRAFLYLQGRVQGESSPETRASMIWALAFSDATIQSQDPAATSALLADFGPTGNGLGRQLYDTYQERDKAGPTTLSFLALSLAKAGRTEEAKVCLRNLENHAVTQKE